jgi:hypothetical protein
MAVALKSLFEKRALALTRARFHAWWEGHEFDEAAALADLEVRAEADAARADAESELFDEPAYELPPRLVALSILWGENRIRPGEAASEKLEPARIGLAADGVLAMLGAGLAAPVEAVAAAHPGRIDVFEWREETFEALQHGVRAAKLEPRVNVARVDLEAVVLSHNAYDGVLSVDDFTYCAYPPHLAQQIMKCLKPGACAVVEAYVGLKAAELATAFASSFAEPQVRAHGDLLQFFTDTGLSLEEDEDLTAEFLALARDGFKQLSERLTQSGNLEPAAGRELAWEAEAWRMRLKLLAQRRLERRRFVLRKPADDQSGNANAPAG